MCIRDSKNLVSGQGAQLPQRLDAERGDPFAIFLLRGLKDVYKRQFVGWDIAGMSPIQFLIDSLKSANIPDADFSVFESPVTPPVMPSVNVH